MSRNVAHILTTLVTGITAPMARRQRAKTRARIGASLIEEGHKTIQTKYGPLTALAGQSPNIASSVNGFFTDEPDMIEYIDNIIQPDEILWDIGANIGLYSVYAAMRGANVYAFEPSGVNFGTLIRHIHANKMGHAVKPFCVALSDSSGMADLNMAEVAEGHASNALGEAHNQTSAFETVFTQTVLSFTGDDFAATYNCPPDHIKLDVDGIEPLILRGMPHVLARAKSLMIEIEGVNENNEEMLKMIAAAGLKERSLDQGKGEKRNRFFAR